MATRSSCSILSLQKETRISKSAASNYSKPSQRKPIMQVHHPTRFSHDSLTTKKETRILKKIWILIQIANWKTKTTQTIHKIQEGKLCFPRPRSSCSLSSGDGARKLRTIVAWPSSSVSCGAVRKIKNSRCASQCGDVDGERRFDGTVRPVVVVLAETKEEYYLRANNDGRIREDDRPSRCGRCVMRPPGHRGRRREGKIWRAIPAQGRPQGGRACHRGS